jgi:transposase
VEIVFERVCGLDVHKKTVVACVRRLRGDGRVEKEVRSFGTFTDELLALSDWLAAEKVTHVAMESTGVFWKPIYNLFEGQFEVLLVNARHIKQVPGRKTDVKDCEWIAQLLQCGLLRASFVPPQPIRQLRDLTRHRVKLTEEKSAISNRIQKVLEDCNVKLASVASDVLGVSGRKILQAMVDGEEDPAVLSQLAKHRLRAKIPELQRALAGQVNVHHRFMLQMLLKHLAFVEESIAEINEHVAEHCRPFAQAVELLSTVPGVGQTTAENLVAEIGDDMQRFPTSRHLASWSGLCPGNNESAGKHKSGKAPKANRWLRRALSEAAWAASHTKDTYLAAQYRRLAPRRGKKRAIVALAHTILTISYHVLKDSVTYQELGGDYFERLDPASRARYHTKKLRELGYEVSLTAA